MSDLNTYLGIYYIIYCIGTIIPFLIIMVNNKVKFSDLFKGIDISSKEVIGEGMVFFTLASVAIFMSNSVSSYFGFSNSLIFNIGTVSEEMYLNSPFYLFFIIAACPILEGFAFRGVLIKSLSKYGKSFALYTSALIYALAHSTFIEMFPAYAIGVMLGKIAIYHKSVLTPILIHIMFNIFILGLTLIPETLTKYLVLLLVLIYVISVILLLSNKYSLVKISMNDNSKNAMIIFFENPAVIVSIIAFIMHTILLRII